MSVILHIISREAWAVAVASGRYAPPSLAGEGFIHCSTVTQVLAVAESLYSGRDDLLLLAIDPGRVLARIVFEDCYNSGQAFPHIYGPLSPDAVIAAHPFERDDDGRFHLPLRLESEVDQPRLPLPPDAEIRLFERHHAAQLAALIDANREHLRQWLPWVDANRTVADSLDFIDITRRQYRRDGGWTGGIWLEDSLAGVIGLHQIRAASRQTGIGYWLGKRYEGQGLVTRACRALVSYIFDHLGLNRIVIHCAVGNERSCAVPQRLGFRHEGILRQNEWLYDRYVDHHVYAMLAAEWPLAAGYQDRKMIDG